MFGASRDYEKARQAMVARQLGGRGIKDGRVLDAMGRVPRERFLPQGRQKQAYDDSALGIGQGQTISQPYMVALMTQALHLRPDDRVLEVGTGSGYQAAILAELSAHVCTVERLAELSERARALLCDELGYTNISFKIGDGTLGWPEESPFDRIMVTAGAPHRPQILLDQLAPHGEAIAPVGGQNWQVLTRYRRKPDDTIEEHKVCDCIFVRLIGEDGW